MPNENKKPSEKVIKKNYKQYEDQASWTAEKLYKKKLFGKPGKNNADSIAISLAVEHNTNGDSRNAIAELKNVDASVYAYAPAGAHNYYSALLTAYLISDDLDHASDTFNKGFYYMNTYKDSPADGAFVSLALGMYENFCGHYDVSLQLLDNGLRVHHSDLRPENRIPDENMTSMICYWKAVNFFAMGDKASAWEMINSCKGLYKTPYYEQLSGQLLDDIAKRDDDPKTII